MSKVVFPAAVRSGPWGSRRLPDAQGVRLAAVSQRGERGRGGRNTSVGAHTLGDLPAPDGGDQGPSSRSPPRPRRHGRSSLGRSPHLPGPRKRLKLILAPQAGAGDPQMFSASSEPRERPASSPRAAASASYLPGSLICYFSLNTPTPIISVILGNNSLSANETCIIGRLQS